MHNTLSLKNLTRAMAAAAVAGCLIGSAMAPVSYTHLTLPTIYSV